MRIFSIDEIAEDLLGEDAVVCEKSFELSLLYEQAEK
jgi:hypothetical protein